MADKYLESNGSFASMMNALASRSPDRIQEADAEKDSGISSVRSILSIVADYVHLREQHPEHVLFADLEDVADVISTASDLLACVQKVEDEANTVRMHLTLYGKSEPQRQR